MGKISPHVPKLEGRLPRLDGLRGVAILGVMIFHFVWADIARSAPARALVLFGDMGWMGVDLFFVLSGFLITGILLRSKEGPSYFKNFYMRRVLRIFPLYYGVLFGIFVILPLLVSVKALDAAHIFDKQAWFWAYSMNVEMALQGGETYFRSDWIWIVHLWSLCIEEHFYLVWPFIVWLATPKAILRVCAVAGAGAVAVRLGMLASHVEPWVIYTLTPCRVDSLVLGAAVAVMARSPQQFAWLRRVAPWSLAGAAAYLVFATVIAGHVVKFTHWTMSGAGFSVIGVGSASALVLSLDAGESVVSRVLEGPILGTFGKYSYGAYVLHHLMLPLYAHFIPFPWFVAKVHVEVLAVVAQVVVETGVSMALAMASWHLYEKHFLNMKRLFEYTSPAPSREQRAPRAASSDFS